MHRPLRLPPPFVERMTTLLGDEADELVAALARAPVAGLRVNTLKLDPARLQTLSPWPLTPVPWCERGFTLGGADATVARPGRHPFHAAGLYYLQEPSAMAVAEALDVRPGQLVLDLAAAPGGKATHLAAALEGRGVLVANEVIGSRIKPLGENLERCGVPNAVLLNDEPAHLADRLGAIFDRVLLDAPCSGEGMFRKSKTAIREWSPEHVAGCALRQGKILEDAARLVRPGGLLLYSTCTFAPEENEARIAAFLRERPDWELVEIPRRGGMTAGRPEWAGLPDPPPLERAARLWPHRVTGEGHFLALLSRSACPAAGAPRTGVTPRHPSRLDPTAMTRWRSFRAESLANGALGGTLADEKRLLWQGERLFLRPEIELDLAGLRVVRPGLPLGEARPGRFEPAHALALALRADDACQVLDLSVHQAERYLAGEQLTAAGPPGWVLVTVEGWPLGWGRRSGGAVKNHYPKGLRRVMGDG